MDFQPFENRHPELMPRNQQTSEAMGYSRHTLELVRQGIKLCFSLIQQICCSHAFWETNSLRRTMHSQFSSVAQSCLTLCDPMNCSTSGLPVHNQLPSLPKPMSIETVMASYHHILCHPLFLLPSIFPSIRVFPNDSPLCVRWPKYWSFSINISPSNEHRGLISFRMDWLDLLEVQGTLKSLL